MRLLLFPTALLSARGGSVTQPAGIVDERPVIRRRQGDALALGRWHLYRCDGYDAVGRLVTLLMRRTRKGRRFVADHTSTARAF